MLRTGCLVLCLIAAGGSAVGQESAQRPPNVLLVMTDDQGYWDTGIAGNTLIDTPVIDGLAKEGVQFSHFYASLVCAPTRAGLMTGRYYLRTGLYNTRFGGDTMSTDEVTLPQLLQRGGYRTGLFGKWHLGKYAGYRPHERGFDEFFGHYHGHIERYDYPDQLVHNGRPVEARGYITDLLTDAAMQFVRRNRRRPFFCFVAYNAPHSPFVAGGSHDGMPAADALISKYLKRGLPLRDARIYAMVEIIDRNLGRLLALLRELDLERETIVIFTSDNGGVSRHFKAGLRGAKGSPWEGGVRVPLVARWPGRFAAGATVDAMASHIDVLPTLCALAGVDAPADRPIDGRNIADLLREGSGQSPHQFVYHTWDRYSPNPQNRWSISDGRYKLVGLVPGRLGQQQGTPRVTLHDLRSDPGESKNLATQHPAVVKRLRTEFLRWFEEVTEGQVYEPVPIPVGRRRVEIQPSWARWAGSETTYTFRGYDWDTIDGWRESGDHARWKLNVARGGLYHVRIAYGCAKRGGRLRLSVGDEAVMFEPAETPSADVFVRAELGTLRLPAGLCELRASVDRETNEEMMRLNRIWLTPAGDN